MTIRRTTLQWIAFLLVAIVALEFHRQNHCTISEDGVIRLSSDAEIASQFRSHNHEGEDVGPTDVQVTVEVQPIVARRYILKGRAGLTFLERGHYSTFEAEIPEFNVDSAFIRKLNQQLRREYHEQAIEFTTFDRSVIWDNFWTPAYSNLNWHGGISIEVTHLSQSAVSILETHSEYTGGVHPNYWILGRCFIEKDGGAHELKLEELFDSSSDWEQQLVEVCLRDLRRQQASSIPPEETSDSEDLQFSAEDLSSFTMSPSGLRFYFSPYHVGCYAEGIYSVLVPYSDIQTCLPETSPVWQFGAIGSH